MEQEQPRMSSSSIDEQYAAAREALTAHVAQLGNSTPYVQMIEQLYSDPAERLAETLKALRQMGGTVPTETPPPAPAPAVEVQALAPAPTAPVASSTTPATTTSLTEKPRRRAPQRLDDPGLTAVVDSRLAPGVGSSAILVWLCLLRHANGRTGRRVEKIGFKQLREGTGLSLQKIRSGLRVLVAHGLVVQHRAGRTIHGEKLTAEYIVPFPTLARIERWLTQSQNASQNAERAATSRVRATAADAAVEVSA